MWSFKAELVSYIFIGWVSAFTDITYLPSFKSLLTTIATQNNPFQTAWHPWIKAVCKSAAAVVPLTPADSAAVQPKAAAQAAGGAKAQPKSPKKTDKG